MPPKNKGKKGKKQDDDDAYWDAKAAALESKSPVEPAEETPQPSSSKAAKKKAGGLFDLLDEGDLDEGDDDEEGGGLMATIRASAAKKDKKKKKKGAFADLDSNLEDDDLRPTEAGDEPKGRIEVDTKPNLDDEWPEEDVKPKKGKKGKKDKGRKAAQLDDEDDDMGNTGTATPTPTPALDTNENGIEETRVDPNDEWPEEDVKPKKGKKGKKGKGGNKAVEEDEDDLALAPVAEAKEERLEVAEEEVKPETPAITKEQPEEAAADEDDEAGEGEGPKILTKKEKEKLKKEKEKVKKKAQAAAKKGSAANAAPDTEDVPEPTPAPSALAPAAADEAEEDDDAEEGGATAADKKKKKKKKPAAKPEPAAAPAAKGKKVSSHIAALQAAMEERKRIEEEAKRVEDERRRKIEEEERRIAEEEAAVEAAKAAKKQKEKDKKAQAKAEGRLLTPAQKKAQAAAEARKQALLAAGGLTVAGLQETREKKKPVYGKKKPVKSVAPKENGDAASAASTTAPAAPVPTLEPEKEEPATLAPPAADDDKDWDKSEDDAAAVEDVVAGVDKLKVKDSGDDWDQSEDESPKPSALVKTDKAESTPAPKAQAAPTPAAPAAASTAKPSPAPAAKPVANGKPATKPATKSKPAVEESSDEESDSDDDNDSDDDSDESESESESEDELEMRKFRARQKIAERLKKAELAKNKDDLRSPICCILGHVDHGKTLLLDKIRQTSVASGEAGGITQQIGATFFPKSAIQEKTTIVNQDNYEVKIPGLLIIDTPGHESFTNLRTRGSSLCNIAILVVDLTQGFQPQTLESLNLLRNGRTPFIVALNKIDRLYGWKPIPNAGFRDTLESQSKSVKSEFEDRLKRVKLALSEQGFNSEIYDENKNLGRIISLVPTSAITGEGIPDMLMLLVKLTQERMNQSLMYISELSCTILEVKNIEGHGMTIDVILSNGYLREGDKIVLCGMDGPIVTNVRALLTPQPLRELRIKSDYVHHKEVKAALGVKISAPGLDKAIAGARLYVAQDEDEVEAYKEMAMEDLTNLARFVEKSGKGVWVQASTLGALEALLTFLQQMKIPVFNFGIGPVFKNTIVKAAIMLDRAPEYAVMLAFDVVIDGDARTLAEKAGMKIFNAPVIYHLFDAFNQYMAEVIEAKKKEAMPNAVWPVRLSILKAFAHRDPIILGCDIIEGTMRVGTPVGVVKVDKETGKREIVVLGKITSVEINHKPFTIVKKSQIGAGAAVKIERAPHQAAKLYGRHFDDKDEVVSLISRQSIDTLKTNFRDQVELSDWAMLKKMKIEQGVQ